MQYVIHAKDQQSMLDQLAQYFRQSQELAKGSINQQRTKQEMRYWEGRASAFAEVAHFLERLKAEPVPEPVKNVSQLSQPDN